MQEEGLRTYLLQYARFYSSLSTAQVRAVRWHWWRQGTVALCPIPLRHARSCHRLTCMSAAASPDLGHSSP